MLDGEQAGQEIVESPGPLLPAAMLKITPLSVSCFTTRHSGQGPPSSSPQPP